MKMTLHQFALLISNVLVNVHKGKNDSARHPARTAILMLAISHRLLTRFGQILKVGFQINNNNNNDIKNNNNKQQQNQTVQTFYRI